MALLHGIRAVLLDVNDNGMYGSSKQPDHSTHDSCQTLHYELGQVIEDGELIRLASPLWPLISSRLPYKYSTDREKELEYVFKIKLPIFSAPELEPIGRVANPHQLHRPMPIEVSHQLAPA